MQSDDTVATGDSSPDIGLSWQMREREAGLLADLLRNSRLTLLYGETGVSRAELLDGAVLPLLARRSGDATRTAVRESRVVVPFIDQRLGGAAGGPVAIERVVLFRDWAGAPLADLQIAILSSVPLDAMAKVQSHRLPDMLAELCDGLGARFLIILDAFEQLWTTGSTPRVIDEFVEQLSAAVNRSDLPVSFLLSVDEESEGRLAALRSCITGFDDSILRLRGWQAHDVSVPVLRDFVETRQPPPLAVLQGPSETLPDVAQDAARAGPPVERPTSKKPRRIRPPKTPLPPAVPIRTDGVYAFIESTLAQTAETAEPWHEGSPARSEVDLPPTGLQPASAATGFRADRDRFELRGMADRSAKRSSAPSEPPHPIDQWLDAFIGWCRRHLGMR